jgi:hypothetical protein
MSRTHRSTPAVVPDRKRDTVIGPIAFTDLPRAYRELASTPDSELEPFPGLGMPAIKDITALRAAARVTLVVPKEQRSWMKLVYGQRRRGEPAITLEACRRLESREAQRRECGRRPPPDFTYACEEPFTLFSGGFGVDVASAPLRGMCAELIVWIAGERKLRREFLFRPDRGDCVDREG